MSDKISFPKGTVLILLLFSYIISFFLNINFLNFLFVLPIILYFPGFFVLRLIDIDMINEKNTKHFAYITVSIVLNIFILWLSYLVFNTTTLFVYIAFIIPMLFASIYIVAQPTETISFLLEEIEIDRSLIKKIEIKHIFLLLVIMLLLTGIFLSVYKTPGTIYYRFFDKDNIYLTSERDGYLKIGFVIESFNNKDYDNATIESICGNYSSFFEIVIKRGYNEYYHYLPMDEMNGKFIFFHLWIDNEIIASLDAFIPNEI